MLEDEDVQMRSVVDALKRGKSLSQLYWIEDVGWRRIVVGLFGQSLQSVTLKSEDLDAAHTPEAIDEQICV